MRGHEVTRTIRELVCWRDIHEAEVACAGLICLLLRAKQLVDALLRDASGVRSTRVHGTVIDADPGKKERVVGCPGRPVWLWRERRKELLAYLSPDAICSLSADGIVICKDRARVVSVDVDLAHEMADKIGLAGFAVRDARELDTERVLRGRMR